MRPGSFTDRSSPRRFRKMDHTNPRSAHWKPECDSSFDGNHGPPIIHGKKPDHRHRRF